MNKYLKNEVREILVGYRNAEISLTEALDWIGEAIADDITKRRILNRKAKARLELKKSIKKEAGDETS